MKIKTTRNLLKKLLRLVKIPLLGVALYISPLNISYAEEEAVTQTEAPLVEVVTSDEDSKYQEVDKKLTDIEVVGKFFIYMALLIAVGLVVLQFFKNKGQWKIGKNKEARLEICETRVLGNKQFLVVVKYNQQKLLLGVGPGLIKKICTLESTEKSTSIKET